MQRMKTAALATFAALVALPPGTGWAQEAVSVSAEVRENVRARVEAGLVPGIVVGMIDGAGIRYFAEGSTALSGGATPDARTVFEVGSVTKVFTAVLLAQMADEGLLSLDDPVSRRLPDGVALPGGEAITLEHLATHASGLPRLPDNLFPAEDRENPYAGYTADDLYAFLADHEPVREPGAEVEYSNLGAGLLGHVLALRAGTSYEEAVRERIADPLGLADTRIRLTDEQGDRLATGHRDGRPVPNWDFRALAGAGALRSTAADLLRFLAFNLGLRDSSLNHVLRATLSPRRSAAPNLDVALGWHVLNRDEAAIVWHNGGTGGFHAFVGFDAAREVGVVVLANSSHDIDDIGFQLLDPSYPLTEPSAEDVE